MSQRRKFDKEFKLMTVELCLSSKSTELATFDRREKDRQI
jgi:hypothetical protein